MIRPAVPPVWPADPPSRTACRAWAARLPQEFAGLGRQRVAGDEQHAPRQLRVARADLAPQRGAVHVAACAGRRRCASKRAVLEQFERHRARLGGGHLVAGAFEHFAHQVGELGLVVDHQHARLPRRARLGAARAGAVLGSARTAADAAGSGESSRRRRRRGGLEHQIAAVLARHRARHRQARGRCPCLRPWS